MKYTQSKAMIQGVEEVEEIYQKKVRQFLFWKVGSWEKVNIEHIANDIIIETNKPIRAIIFNGKEISLTTK